MSQFDDFDAFAMATKPWNLDFRQLDSGSFQSILKLCGQEDFQIGYTAANRMLLQEGSSPAGLRMFVFPTDGCLPMRWRRQEIRPDSMLIFPRNCELEAVSSTDFEIIGIAFTEDYLNQLCKEMEWPEFQILSQGAEVLQCQSRAIQGFRQSLKQALMHLSMCYSLEADSVISPSQKRQLALSVLQLIGERQSLQLPRVMRFRDRALQQAVAFIESYEQASLSMADLCRVSHASERTLEYAFREYYGVTPKQFELRHRLNRVKKKLHMADSKSAKIVNIANQWGFWHMGQFAADYRKLFGELPSDTLQRSC